jgi:hypothetical protein
MLSGRDFERDVLEAELVVESDVARVPGVGLATVAGIRGDKA